MNTETILIACMPFRFSKEDIRNIFENAGAQVHTVELFEDLENATFDAYAHVEINSENVGSVIDALDGKMIGHRPLRVNRVVDRKDTLVKLEERA